MADRSRRRPSTGRCGHCGDPEAPVSADGMIDRHRRLDWRRDVDPGNELCAGGIGQWLRPGEPCQHYTDDARHCADAGARPRS